MSMNSENDTGVNPSAAADGAWSGALDQLREWDPKWVGDYVKMSTNPWTSGVLPRKTVELLCVALNAECTQLNASGTRRHIRAALDAGASRDEILCVFKIATFTAFRASNFGAAILLEEASTGTLHEAAAEREKRLKDPSLTPNTDKVKAAGLWNPAWDASFDFAPLWTDSLVASALDIYSSGALPSKLIEFVNIALGASYSHRDASSTRRCIKAALRHGATVAEIFEVLKICVIHGVQTFNLGVPILAEELARGSETKH